MKNATLRFNLTYGKTSFVLLEQELALIGRGFTSKEL